MCEGDKMTNEEKLKEAWDKLIDEIAIQFRLYDLLEWLTKKLERS